MNSQLLDLTVRLITGGLNALNRKNKKDATDNVADTLANDGAILHSDTTFEELAHKANRT